MYSVKIAASILAADIACLGEQAQMAEQAGADWLHLDIMDGHFVPNITFGVQVVERLKKLVNLPLDVHLMVKNPQSMFQDLANAGASVITVHQEVCPHLHADLQTIKSLGLKAGVAINPSTPASSLSEVLGFADLLLVMSVNPGFGGQAYLPFCNAKIQSLHSQLQTLKGKTMLEVDGGINSKTVAGATKAGANVVVAGTALFNTAAGFSENLKLLKQSMG